jgi:DNA-3-methyladenine glycosylase
MREPSERPSQSVSTRHFRVRRLRRSELPAPTLELARFLIGKTLVRELPAGRIIGRIVETEAYPPGDAAGHAFRGETPRKRSLFLDRGHAYVYFSYGSFWLLNVSSERPGIGAGVLLRALEVVGGSDLIRGARGTTSLRVDLARGPGRLGRAMRINRRFDGKDLCAKGPLWLGTEVWPRKAVGKSVRIGISREADKPFRFYERGNPAVSGPLRLRT